MEVPLATIAKKGREPLIELEETNVEQRAIQLLYVQVEKKMCCMRATFCQVLTRQTTMDGKKRAPGCGDGSISKAKSWSQLT